MRTMLMNATQFLLPVGAGVAGVGVGLTPIFLAFAASVMAGALVAFRHDP